jgi:hypothetical protein
MRVLRLGSVFEDICRAVPETVGEVRLPAPRTETIAR